MNNLTNLIGKFASGVKSRAQRFSKKSGKLVAGGVNTTFAQDISPYINIKAISDIIAAYHGVPFGENGFNPEDLKGKQKIYTILKNAMDYFELSSSEISLSSPKQLDELIALFPNATSLNLNGLVLDGKDMQKISRLVYLSYLNLKGSNISWEQKDVARLNLLEVMDRSSAFNSNLWPALQWRDNLKFPERKIDVNFSLIDESGKKYLGKIKTEHAYGKKCTVLLKECEDGSNFPLPEDEYLNGNFIEMLWYKTYIGQMQNGFKVGQGVLLSTIHKEGEAGLFKAEDDCCSWIKSSKLTNGVCLRNLYAEGMIKEIIKDGSSIQSTIHVD